ncbi:MAG: nucleotidyltransferase family protein [Thermoanaerobaculia bacterium]
MLQLEDLHPPEAHLTVELDWVLRAAFSASRLRRSGELDAATAWKIAETHALCERIGARRRADELPDELDALFRRAHARAAAVVLLYEKTAGEVAEIAARVDAPIAFLKGLALILSGVVPAGARSFSDIDVLVPQNRADELFAELERHEFAASPAEATEQHLPELRPPGGGSLEIHFALRGIEIEPGEPARFETLLDTGALEGFAGFPGTGYLPIRSLMTAHALVHGFQQHLLRPSSYPLFRMVADLIDLAPEERHWTEVERLWHPTIEHAVSRNSFEAAARLCAALRAGHPPEASEQPRVRLLFDHLVVGASDRAYSRSLRRAYLRQRLGEAHARGSLGEYLSRKMRPLFGVRRGSRRSQSRGGESD